MTILMIVMIVIIIILSIIYHNILKTDQFVKINKQDILLNIDTLSCLFVFLILPVPHES